MRVQIRRKPGQQPRPRHTNAASACTPEGTTAPSKYEGDCPLCGDATLIVERRYRRGYPPWKVFCRKAACCGLDNREWLREVAATVGAGLDDVRPYDILEDAPEHLADYLGGAQARGEAAQLPSADIITNKVVRLHKTPHALEYLRSERGLTERTLRRAQIGWESDPPAFTIPITDARGELVNVARRPFPTTDPARKYQIMSGRTKDNGGIQLYSQPLPSGKWILVEGLFDALLGRQEGLSTVTACNGTTWLDEWLPLVRGREVAVMYDVGVEGLMRDRVAQLRAAGAVAWPVYLARLRGFAGKDLTDTLLSSHTPDEIKKHIINERRRAEA